MNKDDLDDKIAEKCTELTNLFIEKFHSEDSINDNLDYLSNRLTIVFLKALENSGIATLGNLALVFDKLFSYTLKSLLNLKNSGEERGKTITIEKLNQFKECVIMSYKAKVMIDWNLH